MKYIPSRKTWVQILFWGGLWVLIPVLLTNNWDNPQHIISKSAITLFGIIIVIWVNLEVLLPRLYFQKRNMLLYSLAGLTLVIVLGELIDWDNAPWAPYYHRMPRSRDSSGSFTGFREVRKLMPFFTAFIGSTLFEIASFANRTLKEAAVFRSEKLEAEMKFLKSQINPHFLFNALNNIYTLTVIKSDKASDNLLKLSGMLRYMLYDCKDETVPLYKEIAYLRHFIDLNLLKDSGGLNVQVQFDESRPGHTIAPMLLIPFVENAFKHSRVEDLNNGWIKIDLQTNAEKIFFDVQNSRPDHQHSKDKVGGIGLSNVKRQLELLYPQKHILEIMETENAFSIHLEIQLL